MAAAYLPLIVEIGSAFSRTLLFGTGVCFCVNSLSDMGGGKVKASAPGHTFQNGDQVKVIAIDPERCINYAGSFVIADVVEKVSFSITTPWQGNIKGTAQLAKDLTGYGYRAAGRATFATPEVLVDFDTLVVDAVAGVVSQSLDADITEGYSETETAVWTGELYSLTDAADVSRALQGPLEITPEAVY